MLPIKIPLTLQKDFTLFWLIRSKYYRIYAPNEGLRFSMLSLHGAHPVLACFRLRFIEEWHGLAFIVELESNLADGRLQGVLAIVVLCLAGVEQVPLKHLKE